jgi:hypothetical protein
VSGCEAHLQWDFENVQKLIVVKFYEYIPEVESNDKTLFGLEERTAFPLFALFFGGIGVAMSEVDI